MNQSNTLRNIVLIMVVFVLGIVILGVGFFLGRMTFGQNAFFPGGMMGYGPDSAGQMPMGMMGGSFSEDYEYAPYGQGMMSGNMMGGNMMGGFNSGLAPSEPVSIEQAETAVTSYLDQLADPNLGIAEIMIFENHAYAEIVEQDTGIGAMEVLVDPVSLAVYPEPGPNMMWNLKYGMMAGYGSTGMMGGMMGRSFSSQATPRDVEAEMPVTADEALESAQQYLDQYLPGSQVGEEAEAFYGYYTIHIERDGIVVGMLSVNGYNAQVFPHTWHGQFIEMSAEEH